MIDLKKLSREMDRGIFCYSDAVQIINEYEKLGLEGCQNAIDRIDHGYDSVEDLRSIHNAIELAYARAEEPATLLTEASPKATLRESVQRFFGA